MTDHPVTESIAAALVSLSATLATLTREIQYTRGLASALEERIAALEAKANKHPAVPTHVSAAEYLQSRNGVLFIGPLEGREIRDGRW